MDHFGRDHVSLCFCSIGGTTLAFSSDHLKSFIGPEVAPAAALDLAERLALVSDDASPPQTALLSFSGTERVVRLGSSVRLRTVPLLQLHPLPALVSGLRRAAGLAGVVLEGQQFALLIDLESLE
jgi:hypothetical protein